MRTRSLFALFAAFAFVACGDDDPTPAPAGDTGTADTTDTGADTPDEDTQADGGVCESGFECLRLSDCAGAGLTTPSCVAGCCVEGTPVDPPDPPAECGDITFQGECEGTVVRWCDPDDGLQEIDCATEFFDGGQTGSCEEFTADFGFFCAAAIGDVCLRQGGSLLCGGTDPAGCVITDLETPDGSACTVFEADCVSPEGDDFPGYCEGDLAVFGCNVDQPFAFDCAAFTGSCSDGNCIDIQPGGPCWEDGPTCAGGLTCEGETDESLGTCTGEVADPTCEDGVQNGDEEGVDCGGSCDPCEAETTCEDEEMNGDETDVDCGGATCDPCADGAGCAVGEDCESGVCGEGLCAAPTCEDGVQNGDEGGVDCDGSCEPCEM